MSYADDCLNRILSLPKRESRLEWRRAQRKELKALEATRSALEEKAHIDTALKNHFFITYRFTEDRGFRALGIAPDLDAKWLSQYKKCQRAVRDVYFGVRDDQVRMKLIATQRAIEQHVSKWACGASGMAAGHVEASAGYTTYTAASLGVNVIVAVGSVVGLYLWLGLLGGFIGSVVSVFLATRLVLAELLTRHVSRVEMRQALQELENDSLAYAVLQSFPAFFDYEEQSSGQRAEWYEKALAERQDWLPEYPARSLSKLGQVHPGDNEL